MLNDLTIAKKLSENAYNLVNKHYTIEKIADNLDKSIKQIINNNKK